MKTINMTVKKGTGTFNNVPRTENRRAKEPDGKTEKVVAKEVAILLVMKDASNGGQYTNISKFGSIDIAKKIKFFKKSLFLLFNKKKRIKNAGNNLKVIEMPHARNATWSFACMM